MDIQEYIKPELLILIPVMYLIGVAVKKSGFNDKYIPWVLGVTAIVLSAIWTLANGVAASLGDIAMAVFVSITQGVLIAGASVYVNQLIKQTRKEE